MCEIQNFNCLAQDNKIAFTGNGKRMDSGFVQLDFSIFNKPGYYRLKVGNLSTKPFPIGDDAYLATAWHTLNFFFAERCGYDQPGIHQVCHLDAVTVHPDGRQDKRKRRLA